jgi:hypothetical protein
MSVLKERTVRLPFGQLKQLPRLERRAGWTRVALRDGAAQLDGWVFGSALERPLFTGRRAWAPDVCVGSAFRRPPVERTATLVPGTPVFDDDRGTAWATVGERRSVHLKLVGEWAWVDPLPELRDRCPQSPIWVRASSLADR